MAKYLKNGNTDSQLFTGAGKTSPAFGMGAREFGGPQVRGREAHVQVREQNSGMMPAEDYRAAKFLPALWQDLDRNGAPYSLIGGAVVGQAGITDGTDTFTYVHQVMGANAGVAQRLQHSNLDVGLTIDVDSGVAALPANGGELTVRVGAIKAAGTDIYVAGNKPLAYTPTNVIGTAWNDVYTNQKFDVPVTMKTQWLTMYPIDDLFMYGGSLLENAVVSRLTISAVTGSFSIGEIVTLGGVTSTVVEVGDDYLLVRLASGALATGGLTGVGGGAATVDDVTVEDADGSVSSIEVDDVTIGFSRSSIGYAPVSIDSASAGNVDLSGIQTGDKVMPNPYLPGKLISVEDFVRLAVYDTAGDISNVGGLNDVIEAWKVDLGAAAGAATYIDCLAYAEAHVVGICFMRQSRATFDGSKFIGKDIQTEIMSFMTQPAELNLQGSGSDGFEADQEVARQFAKKGLANANTADVIFINFNIK